MKKKNKLWLIIGIVAVVLIIVGIVGFSLLKGASLTNSGNGIYDPTADPNHDCKPREGSVNPLFMCCFDNAGNQVDCRDGITIIGPKLNTLAIITYGGTSGHASSIKQGFKVTNLNSNSMIAKPISVVWTSTEPVTWLNTGWAGVINNTQTITDVTTAPNNWQAWNTLDMGVQQMCPTTPATYQVVMDVEGTVDYGAGYIESATKQITGTFICSKDIINFNIDWGSYLA